MIKQVSQYPIDALVKVVREAVLEVQQNVQAPMPLCAVSALSTLAAATQEKIKVILPWGGYPKQVGTYWAVIAESGERKTAVDNIFGREIGLRDLERKKTYTADLTQYETENRIWNIGEGSLVRQIAALDKNGEPADELRQQLDAHLKRKPMKPRLRRLVRQDINERAIMDALEGMGESIAVICNEGEILLRSALLSKPSLLNKAWDGGPFHFDRKDHSIAADDIRSTVSLMVQSAVLEAYLDKRGKVVRGSGLWARFLICWPPSMQGWRYTSGVESTWESLDAYHGRIKEILADDMQYVYEFDADAKAEFITLLNRIEEEIRPWGGGLSDISDFASKAGENTARISALLHHVSQQQGKITADTLYRAWAIVQWHLEEAQRIFSPQFGVSQVQSDAQLLESYLRKRFFELIVKVLPRTDVLHCGPIRDLGRFNAALDYLEAQEKIWIGTLKRTKFINLGQYWQQY